MLFRSSKPQNPKTPSFGFATEILFMINQKFTTMFDYEASKPVTRSSLKESQQVKLFYLLNWASQSGGHTFRVGDRLSLEEVDIVNNSTLITVSAIVGQSTFKVFNKRFMWVLNRTF